MQNQQYMMIYFKKCSEILRIALKHCIVVYKQYFLRSPHAVSLNFGAIYIRTHTIEPKN